MPGKVARLIALALGWAGLGAILWLTVQWLQLSPPAAGRARALPEVSLEEAELVHYDAAGERVWSLRAAEVALDEDSHTTRLREVEVRFWGEEAAGLTLHAAQLVLDNVRGNWVLEGGVRAQDDVGLSLVTERARWDAAAEMLEGDAPVRVRRGELELSGEGFRYDARAGTLLVQGEASLRLNLGPEADR